MPTYAFQAKDGAIVERFYRMTECPKSIRANGKVYKLTAFHPGNVTPFCKDQVKKEVSGWPRVDYTVPRGTDLGAGVVDKPGTLEHGRPIVTSHTHEREVCAKTGMWRDAAFEKSGRASPRK